MLQPLFGNRTAEMVFYYLLVYKKGYARQISSIFNMSLNPVQKQLLKFEEAGILVSRRVGTSRVFTWNPRDPALDGLRQLLKSTLEYGIPADRLKKYYRQRRRPRRQGKPL